MMKLKTVFHTFLLALTPYLIASTLAATAPDYQINQTGLVLSHIQQVEERNIAKTIDLFSSFPTRHYQTQEGIAAMKWLARLWKKMAMNRNDITVTEFKHEKWEQPTIILSIKGKTYPHKRIILGGHGDSINTDDFNNIHAHAPGADDNASGIATLTEILRILIDNSYQPEHTVEFIAYSAEEDGIQGSYDLADIYRNQNVDILGVLQLDGTNYKGSADLDIVLISDYTNEAQNNFLGQLIDTYLKVPWGYDECGYGCSDHAAWHYEMYPVSFPFESRVPEENPNIHTARDTFDFMNNDASHSVHFAKLSLAYLLELDR